ncbi:uncharacterized protein AAHN32_013864 [Aegotheles albertisi]
MSSAAEPQPGRKLLKPLMEKRRRDRMNRSLDRLRLLLLAATRDERLRNPKVEKAEILQKTVQFLRAQPLSEPSETEELFLRRYRSGYQECLLRAARFLQAIPAEPPRPGPGPVAVCPPPITTGHADTAGPPPGHHRLPTPGCPRYHGYGPGYHSFGPTPGPSPGPTHRPDRSLAYNPGDSPSCPSDDPSCPSDDPCCPEDVASCPGDRSRCPGYHGYGPGYHSFGPTPGPSPGPTHRPDHGLGYHPGDDPSCPSDDPNCPSDDPSCPSDDPGCPSDRSRCPSYHGPGLGPTFGPSWEPSPGPQHGPGCGPNVHEDSRRCRRAKEEAAPGEDEGPSMHQQLEFTPGLQRLGSHTGALEMNFKHVGCFAMVEMIPSGCFHSCNPKSRWQKRELKEKTNPLGIPVESAKGSCKSLKKTPNWVTLEAWGCHWWTSLAPG